ncbi:MAG TPA: glycosyltransferase [Bacteroidota bacterium]|nr:glycosyltransferase [Bacteroidota bacterium]
MKFSIIIPTYNEEANIEECLQSILSQNYPRNDFEIIVSDGSSSDRTVPIAQQYADKVVVDSKRGIAHGRNFGAQHASGEILVFVDCDVNLRNNFLQECSTKFQDKELSGLCGKAMPRDGNFFARFVYYGTYYLVRIFSFFGLPLYPGMCVAYRRTAFEKVGGFREDLGISEDIDLSKRISKIGKCIVHSRAKAFVSTRRLRKYGLSTVLFHIWNDLKYLFTGNSASVYPKAEELHSWTDLWKHQKGKIR